MAGDEVKVDPDDLHRKAELIDGIPWVYQPGGRTAEPPRRSAGVRRCGDQPVQER